MHRRVRKLGRVLVLGQVQRRERRLRANDWAGATLQVLGEPVGRAMHTAVGARPLPVPAEQAAQLPAGGERESGRQRRRPIGVAGGQRLDRQRERLGAGLARICQVSSSSKSGTISCTRQG